MHAGFRCGQLRPERKNLYSLTRLVVQRVHVRAPFAEPEVFNWTRFVFMFAERLLAVNGFAMKAKEFAPGCPSKCCRTTGIRAFWV